MIKDVVVNPEVFCMLQGYHGMCSFSIWGCWLEWCFFFFFQAEDGIRDIGVTGVQTCALPISIAFGEDRCLAFFFRERAWKKERKRGYTFAHFLLDRKSVV